jgi:hypothetical protein
MGLCRRIDPLRSDEFGVGERAPINRSHNEFERERSHASLTVSARTYADCGNLKDARANNFQPLSCFCQTCRTPILVLVTLPSSSLSDTHR